MRRVLALLLFCWAPLMLQAAPYYPPQETQGLEEPARVLRAGIETLSGYLNDNHGIAPPQLQAFLEQEIVPYFDFERMAFWAAGSMNRYLNPLQRSRLTLMLKERFIAAMVEQLGGYRQSRIQYLQPRGNPGRGDVTLGVRVFGADSYPVQLDFRLYHGQQGWRVYDVMANGVSAVAHYRNEYAQMARRYGVQGFLAQLDY